MQRKILFLIIGLMVFLAARPAVARLRVNLNLNLPVLLPPAIEVHPGIQVVQDLDEEIFRARGFYWVRRNNRWYRSRDHRGHWESVRYRRVPRRMKSFKPGQYRRYRHDQRKRSNDRSRHVRARERKEERRERKERKKDRHDRRKRGRGKHKGRH